MWITQETIMTIIYWIAQIVNIILLGIIFYEIYILYCLVTKKEIRSKNIPTLFIVLDIVILGAALIIISDVSIKLAIVSLIIPLITFIFDSQRKGNSEQNTKEIIRRLNRIEECLMDRLPAPEPTQPPDGDDPTDRSQDN